MRVPSRLILSTALLGAVALIASSCMDAEDVPGATPLAEEAQGTLQVALETGDLDLDTASDLELRLDVALHGQAEPIFSESRPLATLTPFVIYLAPASYDVSAEVSDTATGEVLYTGSASGVVVTRGQVTGLTLTLEVSGALQILVDLGGGGQRFADAEAPSTHNAPVAGRGAVTRHRDADGNVRYWYLRTTASGSSRWQLFVADTAAELATMTEPTYTDDAIVSGYSSPQAWGWSLAFAGDDLFILRLRYNQLKLYRWDADEEASLAVADIPVARRPVASGTRLLGKELQPYLPIIHDCALEIQDSFRVVCTVSFKAKGSKVFVGLVTSESVDGGTTWGDLLPYADEDETLPTFLTDPKLMNTYFASSLGVSLVSQGGVSRIYYGGAVSSTYFRVYMASSFDGQRWTAAPEPVFSVPNVTNHASLLGVMPSEDVASDPGAWHLFYGVWADANLGTSGTFGHATSD